MNKVQRVEKGLDRSGLVKTWNELAEQTDYVRGLILIEAKKDCDENSSLSWEKYLEAFKVDGKNVSISYSSRIINATKEKAQLKEHLRNLCDNRNSSLSETEAELRLPDSASTQMELKGNNAIEKAINYQEVIKATGKDNPSAGEIRNFNQQKKQSKDLYEEYKKSRTIDSSMSEEEADARIEDMTLTHMSATTKLGFEDWAKAKGYDIVFNQPKLNNSMYGLKDPSIKDLYIHSNEWKPLFKKLSKILHPDMGGSESDMQMLNRINNLMSGLKETLDYNEWEDKVFRLKKQWKAEQE